LSGNDKILLVLDIDETLIHARNTALDREADFMIFHYHVYKRPFLDEFLTTVQEHFKIAFWSSASDDYVEKMVETIFPEPNQKEFVWGRKRCTPRVVMAQDDHRYNSDGFGHYNYIKRMKKVKDAGYPLERVLMVDDTPHKINNSFGNAIYMKEFKGESEDLELKRLLHYLMTLKDLENVRLIEKRGWQMNDWQQI
jgi:carboxy-terminal domain RNA polymerase II polypeptide A small phosphatase